MLYHIEYYNESFYVEAENLGDAIGAWRAHLSKEWGDNFDGREEPDSIHRVHDEPVIRAESGT